MRVLHEIAIFQTVKSKVIISLFETVSLRNLYNSLNSIKERWLCVKFMSDSPAFTHLLTPQKLHIFPTLPKILILKLSAIPSTVCLVISKSKDHLKHSEISVLRHIRFAELRKIQIEQPNFTNKYVIWLLKLKIYTENIVENGRRAISPLIHNILLPEVRFPCLKKDQIFSSR